MKRDREGVIVIRVRAFATNPIARLVVVRLITSVGLLFAVSVSVFSLVHLSPGSPEQAILGDIRPSPAVIEAVRKKYHLDASLVNQYEIWAGRVIHFDFGTSYRTGASVRSSITSRLAVTAELAGMAFPLAIILGVCAGTFAAIRRRALLDRLTVSAAIAAYSAPAFVTGIALILVFGVWLPWLPVFGAGSGSLGRAEHLVLPAIALAATGTGGVMRVTRASMIETLESEFIAFSRSRGINPLKIITYALRNALVPLITISGNILLGMIAGVVLVESTFSLPGLGTLLLTAIESKDIPTVQGIAMLMAVFVAGLTLVVELLYVVIDPRIRLGRGRS